MCHHEDYKVNWPEKAETMTQRGNITARLRNPDCGWSGDAWAVGAEIAEEAADEIERLLAVLYEVTTNGRWTEGEQCGEWAISNAVYETARDALANEQEPKR